MQYIKIVVEESEDVEGSGGMMHAFLALILNQVIILILINIILILHQNMVSLIF